MQYIDVLIMLAGASSAGLFVYQLNKTLKWFAFEILAIGAHGLMLVAMALHTAGVHLPFMDMQTIGVLASLPMLARLAFKMAIAGDPKK